MIEVIINGTKIDLISEGVEYTKQVNDFSDISTVNTSFTYSLEANKTPINTRLFKQLGMIGDTSGFPYDKNTVQLIDNGAVLIEKGVAFIKETSEAYSIVIQDGIVEVFKAIENKNIGLDLDLSEINHDKNLSNIISSWNEDLPYKYLIANYNGETNDTSGINIDYQIPSVSVKYLLDKVFTSINYTYSGDLDYIKDKYITYPKPPEVVETDLFQHLDIQSISYSTKNNPTDAYKNWNSPTVLSGVTIINNWKILINTAGVYKITFSGSGEVLLMEERAEFQSFNIDLKVNGQRTSVTYSNAENEKEISIELKKNDLVELEVPEINSPRFDEIIIDFLKLKISSSSRETVDFSDALSDFKISDFLKEIMFRGALTPFTDPIQKHVIFKSLKNRLDTKNAIDLSDKYVKRTGEYYTFGNYAQKNTLKLKYNDQEDRFNDASIVVKNKNIDPEKPLFKSNFYSPEENLSSIRINGSSYTSMPILKVWERIVNNDPVEGISISYKGLKNRFYLVTPVFVNETISLSGDTSNGYFLASTKGTTMPEVVLNSYGQIDKIFTDTRIHQIELALSAYDFANIKLEEVYYFEQESQYYIVNKLKWKSGKISKGEFLRIKK